MTLYGLDISSNQPTNLPINDLPRQGFSFLTARCSIGKNVDGNYPVFYQQAKQAKILFAAYHFLKSHTHTSISLQVDATVAGILDKTVPLMLDVESDVDSLPSLADMASYLTAVRGRGVRVPSLYLPRWYWTLMGAPKLPTMRLVASNYEQNWRDYASVVYANELSDGVYAGWDMYGGLTPTIAQIGSRIKIDGYTGNLDGDVFKGTIADLKATGMFKDWSVVVTKPITTDPTWLAGIYNPDSGSTMSAAARLLDIEKNIDEMLRNQQHMMATLAAIENHLGM